MPIMPKIVRRITVAFLSTSFALSILAFPVDAQQTQQQSLSGQAQQQVRKLTPEEQQAVEQYKAQQQRAYEQQIREQQRQMQAQGNTSGAQNQTMTPEQVQQLRQRQQQGVQKPRVPEGHANQTPAEKKYINDVLDLWQKSSEQVKRFKCQYTRWDYNPEFVNWRDPRNNKLAAMMITVGEIRYLAPDKGMFESTGVWDFEAPPKKEGEEPAYKARDKNQQREKWICDGKKIFDFDFTAKRLYETEIPPSMQGEGLVNSPLPFLFGADKDNILNRYWIRNVTPAGAKQELWLEAFPKRLDDARNYKKLEVVISAEDFLPKGIHIYAPNYDAAKNPVSRYFAFKDRKVNDFAGGVQQMMGTFVKPTTPMGWKRIDRATLAAQEQNALGQTQQPQGQQPLGRTANSQNAVQNK